MGMRTRLLLAALCAALVAAGSALGAASVLTGTFQAKVAGKTWTLKLLPVAKFRLLQNGKPAANGTYSNAAGTMTFVDLAGPRKCPVRDNTGIYTYRLAGKKLTLKPLAESCKARQAVLAGGVFIKTG
jgi:hypothetical protein